MWLVTDGWYSMLVHWKRDGQTFWRDQIFRVVRLGIGLALIGMGGLLLWYTSAL